MELFLTAVSAPANPLAQPHSLPWLRFENVTAHLMIVLRTLPQDVSNHSQSLKRVRGKGGAGAKKIIPYILVPAVSDQFLIFVRERC